MYFDTMSETYTDDDTSMGDIFEKMWTTDTSPVFFLTEAQENGMKNKTHEFRMYVSGENCKVEKLYTQQTFVSEKIGNMVNLVDSALVKVRIECVKKRKEQFSQEAIILVEVAFVYYPMLIELYVIKLIKSGCWTFSFYFNCI